MLRRLKLAVQATEKMIKSKRAELRPIAIRRLQEEDSTDQVARGNEDEQELAMLDELEQQLNLEIKSITEGNQTLTTRPWICNRKRTKSPRCRYPRPRSQRKWKPSTSSSEPPRESGPSRMPSLLAPGTRRSGSQSSG